MSIDPSPALRPSTGDLRHVARRSDEAEPTVDRERVGDQFGRIVTRPERSECVPGSTRDGSADRVGAVGDAEEFDAAARIQARRGPGYNRADRPGTGRRTRPAPRRNPRSSRSPPSPQLLTHLGSRPTVKPCPVQPFRSSSSSVPSKTISATPASSTCSPTTPCTTTPSSVPSVASRRSREFMEHMEEMVPKSGATFASWHTEADTNCGWAAWDMVAPNADGEPTPVPGQSLYRLRDGKVTFVADYLDTRAYAQTARAPMRRRPTMRPRSGCRLIEPSTTPIPTVRHTTRSVASGRSSPMPATANSRHCSPTTPASPTRSTASSPGREQIAGFLGRMEIEMPEMNATFELVDAAGDETVGWSQWCVPLPERRRAGMDPAHLPRRQDHARPRRVRPTRRPVAHQRLNARVRRRADADRLRCRTPSRNW